MMEEIRTNFEIFPDDDLKRMALAGALSTAYEKSSTVSGFSQATTKFLNACEIYNSLALHCLDYIDQAKQNL